MSTTRKFYITLPSNVKSNEYHEQNTITNYKTILSKRIEFPRDEKWEVGLAEINYTKSWFNVRNNIQFICFDNRGENIHKLKKSKNVEPNIEMHESDLSEEINDFIFNNTLYSTMYSKPGHYKTAEILCEILNEELKLCQPSCDQVPEVIYIKHDHHVKITPGALNNKYFYPDFGAEIENILGLIDDNGLNLREKTKINYNLFKTLKTNVDNVKIYPEAIQAFTAKFYKSYRPVELNAGLTSLYVYSNIVEHTCVGNAFAQLLRSVEILSNKHFGDQINIIYDKPHFIPLQTNFFDTIEIDIRDDTHENIPFKFGRVSVKLIFKKNE